MSNSGDPRSKGLREILARYATQPAARPVPEGPLGDAAREQYEREQEAKTADHLAACGVPANAIARVVGGFESTPAVVAMREWAKSAAPFLVLVGGVGSGKTTAAALTLKLARKPAYFYDDAGSVVTSWRYVAARGMWIEAVQLANTSPWKDGEGKEVWDRARAAHWLVIDDLGEERASSEVWREHFQSLINHRYQCSKDGLRTVITSNLPPREFVRGSAPQTSYRYGPRVADRLCESGLVFSCGDKSLRQAFGAGQ